MLLHLDVQEYIHTQFAVEDPKSPTQEHHPYTELPKAMNWSLSLLYRITTLGYREGANPTPHWMGINLTKPKRQTKNSPFCRLSLGPLPLGGASSSSCAPAWRATKGLHPAAS